ncbi:aspartyl/asparaginyl beta-hydroxylase domain-containing protein [Caldimonas sp. KR1-144]|uniref:aspartyl/asparaginyl beta-hydroxylase domain-containing protein n=1 Tax=Caldimonas sp. KR1-144 TaxID=3400911 RepID=UPI003C103510
MNSTNRQAIWASDPRWTRAREHALRGEVLQAEMLLRGLLAEHRDCTPARLTVADYMAERGDLDGALQLLLTPRADDSDGNLGFAVARVQVARGDPAAARAALEAALGRQPRFLEAWLMLAEVCDVLGDAHAALRARTRLFAEANAQGRWTSHETTEPQWQQAVRRNIEAYRRDKRERLFAAFAEVRERHGADSLRRFERALTGYLREWDATPPDARQRPKFFWFPDLPPGPYHDPMLQPWAATLRDAWQDIRDEAVELLREDRDFESFLGLKPGQKAPGSIGGAAENPAWDAFFFYNHGVRYDANHERSPRTSALLESIELCRIPRQAPEICFSLIRPQSSILPHYGVTNVRLVFHLPLVVPPDCALNVAGIEHHWREGEPILFDDTYEHEAWNRSDQPRLILLMDCWNPHLTQSEKEAVRHVIEAIDELAL